MVKPSAKTAALSLPHAQSGKVLFRVIGLQTEPEASVISGILNKANFPKGHKLFKSNNLSVTGMERFPVHVQADTYSAVVFQDENSDFPKKPLSLPIRQALI